jgi:hypothetical protein
MDAKDSTVRRYLAQRAELLGAIRLPNDAFKKNAGAEVVSDIIFLQKRDRPLDIVPEWTQTGQTEDGFAINRYFIDHPEMVLGRQEPVSTAHGMDYTVNPIEGLELSDQLHDAVKYIHGTYHEAELPELGEGEAIDTSIPADPMYNTNYKVPKLSYGSAPQAVVNRSTSAVDPYLNAPTYVAKILEDHPVAEVKVNGVFAEEDTKVNATASVESLVSGDYDIIFALTANGLTGNDDTWLQQNAYAKEYSGAKEPINQKKQRLMSSNHIGIRVLHTKQHTTMYSSQVLLLAKQTRQPYLHLLRTA